MAYPHQVIPQNRYHYYQNKNRKHHLTHVLLTKHKEIPKCNQCDKPITIKYIVIFFHCPNSQNQDST